MAIEMPLARYFCPISPTGENLESIFVTDVSFEFINYSVGLTGYCTAVLCERLRKWHLQPFVHVIRLQIHKLTLRVGFRIFADYTFSNQNDFSYFIYRRFYPWPAE